MSLIKVDNLKIAYDNTVVVDGVSFEVNRGDYLCIIGENGSGKTSLVKCLLGLLPRYGGSVVFAPSLMRNRIGYLSQQTGVRGDFPASVKEIVLSGFLNNRLFAFRYSKQEIKKAEEIAQLVGISDIFKCAFSQLSGGQQQRVLLARALCATGELVLLDEPTSALDPIATADFYDLLKKLSAQGITVIMVSHDVTAAVRNASHILCLAGKESFFGTTHQYVHSEVGRRMLLSDCPCDDCKHFAKERGEYNA